MAKLRNFSENHLQFIGNPSLSPGDEGYIPFDVLNGDYVRVIIKNSNDYDSLNYISTFYSKILQDSTGIITEGTALIENSTIIDELGEEKPFTIYKDGLENFYIKPNDVLDTIGLVEGNYYLQIDFLNRVNIIDDNFIIREISPSRLEVRLKLENSNINTLNENTFIDDFNTALTNDESQYKFNFVLVHNEVKNIPIVNYTFDTVTSGEDNQSIILKLYEAFSPGSIYDVVSIEREVLITQTDSIFYKGTPDRTFYGNALDSAVDLSDFEIYQSTEVGNQNYNDLTASFTDLSTINQLITGSEEYPNLNINYQHLHSHTFYGSAKQKLINFKEKVGTIEGYYNEISQSLTISSSVHGTGDNVSLIEQRKDLFDKIQRELNLFTPYERWLYYDGQLTATSSAPSLGSNYSNLYSLNRNGVYGPDDVTLMAPSSSVSESYDGFKNVYTLRKSGSNKTYLTHNDYRIEESPFFNYSGSIYVSFLVKGGTNQQISTGEFSKIHFEVDTESYNGYYTPSASIHNKWLSQPTINSSSWRRYVGVTSASYWYPQTLSDYNTSLITKDNFNDPNVEQDRIRILSGSEFTKTGSNLIYAPGDYQNISTATTASGQTGFAFSGSIMPTGDIIRLFLPGTGLSQESPSTAISQSFITDFKITLQNPTDAYPFAQMYKTGSTTFDNWYDGAYDSASKYDEDNIHSLVNNLPLWIQEDDESHDVKLFLNMMGEQFDIIRNHIDQYKTIYNRDYDKFDSVPPNLLPIIGKSLGWDFIQPYTGSTEHPLAEHFGSNLSSNIGVNDITNATWRKTLNNLIYLYKTKGTHASIRGLLNTYGYPPDMIRISEFGGSSQEHNPAVITNEFKPMLSGLRGANDNVSYVLRKKKLFNYMFRTSGSTDRTIKSDWWIHNANPNTIEFIYKHTKTKNTQELLMSSGSATASLWDLRLLSSNDSLSSSFEFRLNNSLTASLDIPRHAVSMSTDYTVMDEGTLWNVMLQRASSSISGSGTNEYTLAVALQDEDRIPILNVVSMSISGGLTVDSNHNANKNWVSTGSRHPLSSSNLFIGRTASGSMSEFRTWSTTLSASKFKQHTLNKFSVIGNDNKSHKDELIYHYRLNENWTSGSSDVRIIDANPNGPLENPTTYDVSMSLDLTTNSQLYSYDMIDVYTFSLRGAPQNQESNNKIIINPKQSLIGNLNPFKSSTKSLDTEESAARRQGSNKLEMTTGPSNFINDFVMNNLADYDLSKLFGNPENEFSSSYEQLDDFRKEFFDNYEVKVNTSEFIRSNESVFSNNVVNTIKEISPARSTMGDSVGIVIEPNILERTKIKNHRISLESGNVGIHDLEDMIPVSTPTTGSLIQINESSVELPNDALLDVSLITTSSYQPSRNVTLASPVTSSGYYDSTKDAPIDSTLKTLVSYEETKNVELGSPVTSSGYYDSIKDVTIESPLSESFHYEPVRDVHIGSSITSSMNYESEKNIKLNIKEEIVESATYEKIRNVELGSPVSESLSYEETKKIYIDNPINESMDYESTKNAHLGSPVSESIKFEETRNINLDNFVEESANYESVKDVHLGSPVSESLDYIPEQNLNLNIQDRVNESATYESVKDVHLGSSISESMEYESIKDTKIGTPIKESANYETVKNVHMGSSITESMEHHKTKNVELDDFYTESATLETPIEEHFSVLPTTEGSKLESAIIGLSGSTANHININSTAPFRDLINEWGTGIGDTHFINYAAEEETGSRDFNVGHIESRFTFTMVGDTEVVSGSVNSVGDYEIDFTNKKHFYNRLIVDNESSMYRTSQPAPLYYSYFGTGSGIIEGRMMGKTSYFSASADGGWITYPSNHWSNFSRPFTDKMYEGTKNVNPGFFNLVEWEDYSSASFYRVTVTGDAEAVINDGNPTLDEDGNII